MKIKWLVLSAALFLSCGTVLFSLAPHEAETDLPKEIVQLLFKGLCGEGCSDEEVARWKSNLKFEAHDLNADNVPEFVVYIDHSDWCGAGSNCDHWVFQKKEHEYVLLLNDKVFRVKDAVTNGYRDVASETPVGFCDRNVQRLDVTPYKFDGAEYRAQPRETDCRAYTPPVER